MCCILVCPLLDSLEPHVFLPRFHFMAVDKNQRVHAAATRYNLSEEGLDSGLLVRIIVSYFTNTVIVMSIEHKIT